MANIFDPEMTGEVRDPLSFSGFEELVPGKEYIVAFNVGNLYPHKHGKTRAYKTSGGALFERASNNPEHAYGTFKMSTIYKKGQWQSLDYGPALDAAYNLDGDESIGGLFIKITDDFGPNEDGLEFAQTIWDARENGWEGMPPQPIQVRVRIRLPRERGNIVVQTFRGKLQFIHRVMMVGTPIITPLSDEANILTVEDDEIDWDTDSYFEDLPARPLKARSKKALTPANALEYARAARKQYQQENADLQKNKPGSIVGKPNISAAAAAYARSPETQQDLIAEMTRKTTEVHGNRGVAEFSLDIPEEPEEE